MEAKVILFHSNESDKCKAFINNDVSLITSKNGKDDIWLGDGMYFWDNKGNVDWWKCTFFLDQGVDFPDKSGASSLDHHCSYCYYWHSSWFFCVS